MDLKNAAAVCLISLFSATLVVLIARALDSQAAARLEPQLVSIVEELRALRGQGGVAAAPGTSPQAETVGDGLVVYYFHSNVRCPTCRSIESQAHETVQNHFASQLGNGEVIWKVVNYENAAGKSFTTQFEIQAPVIVLAKMKGGKVEDWKRLDEVWALVDDKPAYEKYVQVEIERMLASENQPSVAAEANTPDISAPSTGGGVTKEAQSIPIPQ